MAELEHQAGKSAILGVRATVEKHVYNQRINFKEKQSSRSHLARAKKKKFLKLVSQAAQSEIYQVLSKTSNIGLRVGLPRIKPKDHNRRLKLN